MCIFRLLRASHLCEHRTKAVFAVKLMVGGCEHKVVFDEGGFRMYTMELDWGLNFLSVTRFSNLTINQYDANYFISRSIE